VVDAVIGEITLPWPDRRLHPNARCHWNAKAFQTKTARNNAAWATRAAGITKLDLASLKATITFHPPDNRRRDLDGMLSSLKPSLDGISDAIGVDDSSWELAIRKAEPVKNGSVTVQLEAV
jgi:crossover junction endodeoxyribonuclease RusA